MFYDMLLLSGLIQLKTLFQLEFGYSISMSKPACHPWLKGHGAQLIIGNFLLVFIPTRFIPQRPPLMIILTLAPYQRNLIGFFLCCFVMGFGFSMFLFLDRYPHKLQTGTMSSVTQHYHSWWILEVVNFFLFFLIKCFLYIAYS